MHSMNRIKRLLGASLGAAAIVLAGCASMSATRNVNVSLSGAEQVPPVNTAARGTGSFTVNEDHTVSGSVSITGLAPLAAHIHVGARGKNGPVAVGLTKSNDAVWVVPAGAKFTDDQYKAFLAGETYVNFHTAANKGGEIRAQLQP
jgi:ABC-type Fe3+-hydroxamate transport system substrate-binding protein